MILQQAIYVGRHMWGAAMHGGIYRFFAISSGIISMRNEISFLPRRQTAFAGERKDRRVYEFLEHTLEAFDNVYLIVAGRGCRLRDAGWKLVANEAGGRTKDRPKGQPMCTPLRLLFLLAPLAIAAATNDAEARRYPSYALRHSVTGSIPHAAVPETPAAIDPGPGPLRIPNAALEPAGWGDLDGWAGDDHASAFATLYASCRPIVRAIAFRAEPGHSRAARVQLGRPQPAGKRLVHDQPAAQSGNQPQPPAEARPVRAALEEVCARAIKVGRLGSEAARQFFETNFVPVRIRKLGDSGGFLTG